jgi:hypothetical protein
MDWEGVEKYRIGNGEGKGGREENSMTRRRRKKEWRPTIRFGEDLK